MVGSGGLVGLGMIRFRGHYVREASKVTAEIQIGRLTRKRCSPPTLTFHGTKDEDVLYSQSVAMAAAFKRAGVEHELFTIEGGGHSLWGGDPERIQAAFARSMAQLKESLTK